MADDPHLRQQQVADLPLSQGYPFPRCCRRSGSWAEPVLLEVRTLLPALESTLFMQLIMPFC